MNWTDLDLVESNVRLGGGALPIITIENKGFKILGAEILVRGQSVVIFGRFFLPIKYIDIVWMEPP